MVQCSFMKEGGIFHLLNRGVEKRKIFLNNTDYLRFTHNLRDFNDRNNVDQSYYVRRRHETLQPGDIALSEKEKIVDLLCWALMPNHPHLFIMEREIGNAGIFSRKVFGGYTMYFNEQNKRSGVLFQGKTKIIQIKQDAHFLYLPFYIHANPLDLFQPKWKDGGISDIDGAIKFLEEYRWSNLRDIIGAGNGEFAHLTNKKLFFDMFSTNEKQYRKNFREWIASKESKHGFQSYE